MREGEIKFATGRTRRPSRRRLTISVTEKVIKNAPVEDRWKSPSESWQNQAESSGGLVRHPRIGI